MSLFKRAVVKTNTLGRYFISTAKINQSEGSQSFYYEPMKLELPELKKMENATRLPDKLHSNEKWAANEVRDALNKHCITTWNATDPYLNDMILLDHGSGVYLYDFEGKKYIDFSSQAVCANLGHTVPNEIINAVTKQLQRLPYAYPCMTGNEIRGRMSKLMSDICPEPINNFIFPSSGAEANECAIRVVRRYTGKNKIMSRYRSYHGGTLGALSLTGEIRNTNVNGETNGFIKIFDPIPTFFKWSSISEDEQVNIALKALHEQILHENPNTIAAIFMETITGTLGWVKPPTKYMQGVRALCDKYNILLVFDEVMAGFGRTGKMFAFENFDGVLPDVITFAKGVTSAFLPLSGVGLRENIGNYFRDNALGYGSTYNSHPVSLACAYETVQYYINNNIIDNAKNMEDVMLKNMEKLKNKLPNNIKQYRCIGLAGAIDIANPATGDHIAHPNEAHPGMIKFKKELFKNGLTTLVKGNFIHCAPPLIINETQIEEAFEIIEKSIKNVL